MSFQVALPTATHRRRRYRWAAVSAALVMFGVVAVVAVGDGLPRLWSAPSSSPPLAPASSAPKSTARTPILPAGTSVFDDEVQSVAKLDPGLLEALRRAATEAARDDVSFHVTSGWRSSAEQRRLFGETVAEHGSEAEAARWVSRPGTSAHESGRAVDLGPSAATTWLARHGAGYGLCQIYRNEPWHFELRRGAVDHGCPTTYPDATHHPRSKR